MNRRRVAILGAGPIGLDCLLHCRLAGWEAVVYEKGRIAENVRRWGHVRMFSPWAMNVSDAAREILPSEEVDPEALPTGHEYVAGHLERLAAHPLLAGRVRTRTEVVAVSRGTLLKGERIASRARGTPPFRLLLRDRTGERVEEAEVVIDATGTFATPNWLGSGGIPAVGEHVARGVVRRIPDIEGSDRARFTGRRTLVVGAGHSAATAIIALGRLSEVDPGTRVVWLTRTSAAEPVAEVEDDPLHERARIARAANLAAAGGSRWLERLPGVVVHSLRKDNGGFRVELGRETPEREISVDQVLALVGYRPDPVLTRELQVQTCWATEGTYPLAAALLSQARDAADCLTAGTGLDASTLRHPEPGFFTLGSKSYGRNPNFLLATGFRQVDDVIGLLGSETI